MTQTPSINLGIIAALTAVKKTLSLYEQGMTQKDVQDMINEIDQQLGVREAEMILVQRA